MPLPRRPILRSALLASCVLLAGCATNNGPETTGSLGRIAPKPSSAIEQQAASLRAAGKTSEAVDLLQGAVLRDPKSKPLALAYGRALADAGREDDALEALTRAYDPKKPDWRVPNTEGAILDRLGRTVDAQQRYQFALKLAPDEPAVLSNLGLSLALSEKPAEAEVVLRRAVAQPSATPKIRQNLALVLALQGKYDEAQGLVSQDLSPEETAANMRYWKQTLKAPRAAAASPSAPKASTPKPTPKAAAEPEGFDLRS